MHRKCAKIGRFIRLYLGVTEWGETVSIVTTSIARNGVIVAVSEGL